MSILLLYFSLLPGKYYVLVLWYQKNTQKLPSIQDHTETGYDTPGTRDPIVAIMAGSVTFKFLERT